MRRKLPHLLLAAPYASSNGPYSGMAHVVWGPIADDLSLADADGRLRGERAGDYAGEEIAMGDVDGDGLADAILGAYSSVGGRYSGAAYVVYGPAAGTVDLGDADAILEGTESNQGVGLGLAVGDVDGDGAGELLVGAIGEGTWGAATGAAYLFFGPVAAGLTLDDAAAVFVGESCGDQAGEGVLFGDVDGDGALEVLIGAPAEASSGSLGGAVYVVNPAE